MKKLVLSCAFVCAALAAGAALHPKKSGAPAMGVYRWGAANPNGGAKCVEAFGEWIVGLDNPKFIENMHRVIMETIFPKSAEKFRELFGKRGKKR